LFDASLPRDLLVGRSRRPELAAEDATHPVAVGEAVFGGGRPVIIAGPCAVERREQTLALARGLREMGADILRGGVWKPRTSPYSFQGLGEEALEILQEARAETGLPFVTEVLDPRLVESTAEVADMLQVGSRSMQNFPLLKEVGRAGKPVLLKRAFSATLEEWLCAAEYVVLEGNEQVVLCERGIRTFAAGDYSRNTLDINVLAAAREATWLPVIADPSHATGRADRTPGAALAALAAGAHGLMIEVVASEEERATLRSDASQAVLLEDFARLVRRSREMGDSPLTP
jgi:3-deoxy-7-phosphoheptulonate synthase